MLIKLLEPERYGELPIEANAASCIVVVAEDPQTHEIKGYWMAQLVVHTEPVWLSPELRSGLVGIKLYAALLAALNGLGIKEFYAFADREDIADYLQRLGLTLTPFISYKGVVPERKECLQSLPVLSPEQAVSSVVSQPDQALKV